ncbi:AfsR/SARP family transcriptional regulator [Virgisporangium aurantiacum]|uniref:SARP family transcriptional regulator n=1 Tax=Virgisporangium aurantiacum TaxID=175570 RepID=A0A8J4E665_9ACTN|nr:BTAD domain-containing putative transcriptional regulator [Virgisporangium aurantiacum]GIJ62833.1 SARP family transcriptional regulator [Virgisporangium aurantiacum]
MIGVRLLGPVEIDVDGRTIDAGPPQRRLVLAALAAHPGRPVTVETLIDRVWDTAPDGARRTLHVQVAHIRRMLRQADPAQADDVLRRRSGGYVLDLAPDHVDTGRWHQLLNRSREPDRTDADRGRVLGEALELWRGEPLAGLSGEWAARTREALRQQYLQSVVDWADAVLRSGVPGPVVTRLTEVAGEYPLAEPVAAMLVRALHAAGRSAEALVHYEAVRRRLSEELGTDPGLELRELHRTVLRGEPVTAAVGTGRLDRPVPMQLPADLPVFVGRQEELAALEMTAAAERGAVAISVVTGPGGIGKTSLALHWAHRNRARFPDGQLFVNLRGFDPSGQPVTPQTAMRGFLDALGIPAASIPADADARTGLYRSLTNDRRMLVVLDNARDTEQVTALLPGSGSCVVVVTSRHTLTGLVTGHGARVLPLDVLTDAQSRRLLAVRIGPDRVTAEPAAADGMVSACGGLPLAVAIAAARAEINPRLALAVVATELADTTTRLTTLDEGTGLRAVLSSSYDALSDAEARLLALLSLVPAADFGLAASAALADFPVPRLAALLRSLERQSLLKQHTAGRWQMHDLIHLYATEQADRRLTGPERREALRRWVGFFVAAAYAAGHQIVPNRLVPGFDPPDLAVAPAFTDEKAALTWLVAEQTNLIAAQQLAAAEGWHPAVWRLAADTVPLHKRRGTAEDEVAMWRAALEAARIAGHRPAHMTAQRLLGVALAWAGQHDLAIEHIQRALAAAEYAGDVPAQARTHRVLQYVLGEHGDAAAAAEHTRRAIELFGPDESSPRRADLLNDLGGHLTRLGRYEEAREHLQSALALARPDDAYSRATMIDNLARLEQATGRYEAATGLYRQAVDLYRSVGHDLFEAQSLEGLGEALLALDRTEEARTCWGQALDLYRLYHRLVEAAEISRRLDTVTAGTMASTTRCDGPG